MSPTRRSSGPYGREMLARGMSSSFVGRLQRTGFLVIPDSPLRSAPVRKFTMRDGETAEAFLDRLVADYPPIDAGNAAEFRDALHAMTRIRDTRLPDVRLEQGAAVLEVAAGDTTKCVVTATALSELIGGNVVHNAAWTQNYRKNWVPRVSGTNQIRRELGTQRNVVEALAALGILSVAPGGRCVQYDVDPRDVLPTLTERYMDMPRRPQLFSISDINHLAQAREALDIGIWDRLPPAFLEDLIQFIIDRKHEPTVGLIHDLARGDERQIRDALMRRHREVGDVPFPRRTISRITHTMPDLVAITPPELRAMHGTALDPRRAKAGKAPTGLDIARIMGIDHANLRAGAEVVALHGRTRNVFKLRVGEVLRMLHASNGEHHGLDAQDPAAVAACLTAKRLVAQGAGEDERSVLLDDIMAWGTMVRIFDDYRSNPELPAPLVSYLDAIAPALPTDHAAMFAEVAAARDLIKENRYNERVDDMAAILKDVARFEPTLVARRERTKGFKARVHAMVAAAEAAGADHAMFLLRETHVEEIPRAEGEPGPRKRITTFEVQSWDAVAAELAPVVPEWQRDNLDARGLDKDPRKRALFECRYAVTFVSCLHEDGTPAEPPHWFEFHVRKLLWPVRQLTDTELTERGVTLKRLGLTHTQMRMHGAGLGNFERRRARIARLARTHLGRTLLPLDEHDHQEAMSILQIAMRLDEPLRSGEFRQLNLGSGAESVEDDDGEAFTVFKFRRKKKRHISEASFSPETEGWGEELITITSDRMYDGAGIKPVPASKPEPANAPAVERYLAAYGERSMSETNLSVGLAFLCAGLGLKRPHYLKYLWNRLERLKKTPLKERQRRQEHDRPATTLDYNPATAEDRTDSRRRRRASVQEDRRRRAEDAAAHPVLTDDEIGRLRAERERLLRTIPWLEVRKLAEQVARQRRQLAKVEAALRSVGIQTAADTAAGGTAAAAA